MIAPQRSIQERPEVLPALRALLSQHPFCLLRDVHDLAGDLRARGYVTRRPPEEVIEAALEALRVEGEVLP
jgi:hypothetical protein